MTTRINAGFIVRHVGYGIPIDWVRGDDGQVLAAEKKKRKANLTHDKSWGVAEEMQSSPLGSPVCIL